ncbi:hypothetical protein BG006_006807 [Podila minutissima]|uniref:GDP-fucose protein O-fucosyltransferase 2 n=1 Tax=Podila minutissima TaxID=64525 RepID=A0A9P5SM22_9FUNG|nr:hypothetical protein BG006_006807 [Podila minutissima]
MKRSRVTMARTVLLMCITFAAMALAHLHFVNTLRHERDVEREQQLQHQHDEYIAHNQPIAQTTSSTTIQNNDPTTINNGNTNNNGTKTEPAKTPEFTVLLDTDLTTTVRYTNGTVFKAFKPAFYRDKNKAKKEMGSFMQTLASRSWLTTTVVSSSSTESPSEQDDEEEDDDADAAQGLQPSDTFLAYLPMGGGNNQFTTLQKAALLAKDLNRTLLLPPVSPSSHIKTWSGTRYSDFYNLAAFTAHSGIPVLEWHDVKQTPDDPPKQLVNHWADFAEELPCTPNGGIGVDNKNLYDHFRPQFLLNFKATVPKEDTTLGTATEYEFARDVLLKDGGGGGDDKKPEMWKCLSAPYFLVGPEVSGRSWAEVGLHLQFNSRIEGMVDEILDKLIGSVPAPSTPTSTGAGRRPRRHPEFIIIHLRRGDIVNKCKPGVPESECIVQIEQIAEKVDEIEKKRRIQALSGLSDSNAKNNNSDNKESEKQVLQRLPVLVTTNEKRPEELRKLEKLGWIMLDHGDVAHDAQGKVIKSKTTKLGTFSALGPYWPPMLDAVLLTRGDYLIGMRNSRMSQLAAQRGAAWHGHTTMLM